jgi:eukaryotic-like serine/threonine-protein kinase
MSRPTQHLYEFGPFRLEPAERRLLRDGEEIPLPQKAFDVLVLLVSRAGHLVTKEDLLSQVWPGTFVEEANLSYTVSLLRRALHDSGNLRYIDTVQKLGYRFTAAVRTLATVPSTSDRQTLWVQGPSTPHESPISPPSSAIPQPRHWVLRSLRWAAVIGAGAVLLATTMVLIRQTRAIAPPQTRARFDITVPEHITLTAFDQPVISPDGRRVAFTGLSGGTRRIWVRPLDSSTPILLPGTDGALLPFWSPDSSSLAFFADRKVKRIDAGGGPVTTVCDARFPLNHGSRGAWGGDGVILFGDYAKGPVYRVADTGGVPEPVTRLDSSRHERRHLLQGFMSDNRRFVFKDDRTPATFYVTDLNAQSERRTLSVSDPTDRVKHLTVSQGHLFYAREGAVVTQPFDEQTLEPKGPMITLAETDSAPWQPRPSASRTGIVVFRSSAASLRQLTWRGRQGDHLGVVGSPDLYSQVELSPLTGTRAVLVRGGPWPEDRDLWLADLESGIPSRLTTRPGLESSPVWSPDERRIAYHSSQGGTIAPFVKDLDSGREEQQLQPTEALSVEDWTADGRFLVLRSFGYAVFALPMTGARKLELLADTPYTEDQLQVSPDGRWIAFNSDESDAWEVYVARFPDFTQKQQVSVGGGVQPRWAHDSELFYLTPDGTMMVRERAPDATSKFGGTRVLFKTSLSPPAAELSEYDVTSNGQRFLILEPTRDRPQVFTFLLNGVGGFNK